MNSSFRTAFRALVLSLLIPLTAVVLAELMPDAPAAPPLSGKSVNVTQSPTQAIPRIAQQPGPSESASVAKPEPRSRTAVAIPEIEPRTALSRPALASGNPPTRAVSRTNNPPVRTWSNMESLPDAKAPPPPVEGRSRSTKQRPVMLQAIEDDSAEGAAPYPHLESHLSRLQHSLDQLAQNQQQSQQFNQATQLLQQIQQENKQLLQQNQLLQLENQIKELKAQTQGANNSGDPTPPGLANPATDPANPANDPSSSPVVTKKSRKKSADATDTEDMPSDDEPPRPGTEVDKGPTVKPVITKGLTADDGSERFSLQLRDAEISTVLEMLGEFSGTNILAGKDVVGRVSFNLHDVTIDEALDAILKIGDYKHTREGNFVYVTSALAADAKARLNRKIMVKVYRPYYISATDFQALVKPLLTQNIGKIAINTPSQIGIPTSGDQAGGDSLTQRDAVVVQDYPEIIQEVDNVLKEMDLPPTQVVIEATILSVKLNDSMKLGVNFALLNSKGNQLIVSGNGATLNGTTQIPGGVASSGGTTTTTGQIAGSIVPAAGEFVANTAGLKYGFLRGEVSAFIQALESISDTNLIATPQLMVLNKQRAELIIGERISYKTLAFNGTQTAENVNFLDAGTKLRLRPFIAPDGLIRMEIHPERSSATINATTQLPNLATTEVTTNVMVRDGMTVVIGGLIEEQTTESFDRVPILGALPLVGAAFRNKTESIGRTELIVLITPRLVSQPDEEARGLTERIEGQEREESFRDNLVSFNRRNLARMQFERAQDCYEHGDYEKAWHHINDSLAHSKNDRRALQLKKQIEQVRRPRFWPWARPVAAPAEVPPEPSRMENNYDEPVSTPGASIKPQTKAAAPGQSRPQPKRLTARSAH